METKYNIGDKVAVKTNFGKVKKGDIFTITEIHARYSYELEITYKIVNDKYRPTVPECWLEKVDDGVEEKEWKELHDRFCKVLTWYEHPDEYPFGENETERKAFIGSEMYDLIYDMAKKLEIL